MTDFPKFYIRILHDALKIAITLILSFFSVIASAQVEDSITIETKNASQIPTNSQQKQSQDAEGFLQSTAVFENTKIHFEQRIILDQIKETVQEAKILLRIGVDSIEFKQDLEEIEKQRIVVEKGVVENEGHLRSDRNLAVSGAILMELLERTLSIGSNLKNRGDYLFRLSYLIDSLSGLEAINYFPDDSLESANYRKKLDLVAKEVRPTVENLKATIYELENLESKADEVLIHLQLSSLLIDNERKELNRNFIKREISGFNSADFSDRSFLEIIKISYEKESLALVLYLQIYFVRLAIMVSMILLLTLFIYNLKKRTLEELLEEEPQNNYLVLKYPYFSAIIITIGLFQFFYPSPPFIFFFILWLISGISLAFIFYRFLSPYWMNFWIVVLIFFILVGCLNMVLVFSSVELFLLPLLSGIGLTYGSLILFNKKIKELKEKKIVYFVVFLGLMQILSLVFFLNGSLNLSKALLVSGYIGTILGISLLWTVRLINQMLGLASNIFNKPDKKLFFINFDRVGEKVPGVFYLFLVMGWFSLVSRNFYNFSNLSTYFRDFLNSPRVLGSYTFTINSIVIFIIILAVSFLLSRIVSFFGSDPEINQINSKKRKKISLGSWLLLVQIFIISLGLFLAIAASGVPLEKITIMLGALGVGIGLGLQGLFNNLVSGVIIAFENPVKVGDLIEIDGKPGVMKSIGFRSSVVNMFEGSSIIIPNGELLSNQLVNWTMGKGKKVTIQIGVAYGTDLEKAIKLIKDILMNENRILSYPMARVLPKDFSESSIEIEVTFWAHQYLELPFLRGDIISQIDLLFKKEGIVIAFPQRDLHIKYGNDQIETFPKNPESKM